ncbi:MAG: 4-hydroxy-3-methylbut-2-enyl diphosphate reductase [Deltaproteobacteria bacterium]|nr:4-hydroxy-3-methylbut-2-enyl diphosphate reductase [Deltaproteobacteria bacterium]
MKILLASPRGFCAGVDRAIETVELALRRFGPPIYVRHEIVHNRHVVDSLREKGAVFVDELSDVPQGARVIFSAHGVSPAVRQEADGRKLEAIDATCPLVTKVHTAAQRFAKQGTEIILIGHNGHVEVEGTMGEAPEKMTLVESTKDVESLDIKSGTALACLTQTTLSVDDTREIKEALHKRFPEMGLPRKDDICYATQNRQNAVKVLAKQADLVLVVGSPNSSNSMRLVEIAINFGVKAHLVESASSIQEEWIKDVICVGVTAGASAPEVLVAEVIRRLEELSKEEVSLSSLPIVEENVTFSVPEELR